MGIRFRFLGSLTKQNSGSRDSWRPTSRPRNQTPTGIPPRQRHLHHDAPSARLGAAVKLTTSVRRRCLDNPRWRHVWVRPAASQRPCLAKQEWEGKRQCINRYISGGAIGACPYLRSPMISRPVQNANAPTKACASNAQGWITSSTTRLLRSMRRPTPSSAGLGLAPTRCLLLLVRRRIRSRHRLCPACRIPRRLRGSGSVEDRDPRGGAG